MPPRDIPTLEERVATAKKELEQLKTAQPMAGDSFLFYRGITNDTWDLQFTGITGTTWKRIYKVTLDVADPTRGFANLFYDMETPDNLFMSIEPVYDDPYSYWVLVYHVDYTAAAGQAYVKFYLFAPQRGTISITLIESTP